MISVDLAFISQHNEIYPRSTPLKYKSTEDTKNCRGKPWLNDPIVNTHKIHISACDDFFSFFFFISIRVP